MSYKLGYFSYPDKLAYPDNFGKLASQRVRISEDVLYFQINDYRFEGDSLRDLLLLEY